MLAGLTSAWLVLALAALVGWHIAQWLGLLAALVVALALGLVLEWVQGLSLIRWFRAGDLQERPLWLRFGRWSYLLAQARKQWLHERAQTQQAQKQLEDFLAAFQASPNGVVLLTHSGQIEWFNHTAGFQLALEAGRDEAQFIGHLVRSPVFAHYWAQRKFDHSIDIPAPISTLAKPMRLALALYPYAGDKWLLLSQDITEREQLDATRRDFVANASHELNTPLSALIGALELLDQSSALKKDQHTADLLNMIQSQARRMGSLIHDLLALSRLESSPLPSISSSLALSQLWQLLEQDLSSLAVVFGPRQIHLGRPPQDVAGLLGQANEIHSALLNLVSNAFRYTEEHTAIDIQCQLNPQRALEISIRDHGGGIADEHLVRLTERFFRVDHSRSKNSGGTGLGLAIVKHIMLRHGGELLIESHLGQGSTFTLRFPVNRLDWRQ